MSSRNPFDALPEELWKHIFRRVPHVTRLRSRCVSVQWNSVMAEVEATKPCSPLCCLALEREGGDEEEAEELKAEEAVLTWTLFDTASDKEAIVNLSLPPGWTLDTHGGIQGGGPCGLVAFWDCAGKVYWVGNPVHNMWETVPEIFACTGGTSGVGVFTRDRRFHLLGEETNSGFYKLVQFQLVRRPRPGTLFSWVVQVYSSRSKTWRAEEKACDIPVAFDTFRHSCVWERKVYLLGSIEFDPDSSLRTVYVTGYPMRHPCRYIIWSFDVDTFAWAQVTPPAAMQRVRVEPCWSSVRLQVRRPSDHCRIILVGEPGGQAPTYDRPKKLYIFGLDSHAHPPKWVLEEEVALDEVTNSNKDEYGLSVLVHNPNEILEDFYPDHASDSARKSTVISCFDSEQEEWRMRYMHSPLYDTPQELPVTSFFPCCPVFSRVNSNWWSSSVSGP